MIFKKVPKLDGVILVSPSGAVPAFNVAHHIAERGMFVVPLIDAVVFGQGAEYYIALLLRLREYGASPAQCLLVSGDTHRRAVWDTMFLWTRWGGAALPQVGSLDDTLAIIEQELMSGNWSVE